MNVTLRNIAAVIVAILAGSAVNMGLIMISGSLILPPPGADVTTMEGLQASLHLFQPRHFIFPFLAHTLGTFTGAFVAALLAASHKLKIGLAIGVFFLIGGIINVFMLPTPGWFMAVDLLGAYIPFSYLGARLAIK